MQKGEHTLDREIDKLTGRAEAIQIKSNEVLPSGGLAIPQHVGNASKSTATTPGVLFCIRIIAKVTETDATSI